MKPRFLKEKQGGHNQHILHIAVEHTSIVVTNSFGKYNVEFFTEPS